MTEGQVAISAHLVGATIDVFSTGVWGKEFVWWFHTCMFFLTQWHLPSVLLALVREGCVCIFIFVKSTHAAGVFTSDTTPPHTLVQLKSLNPVPLEMGKTRLGKFIKQ